MKLSLKEFAIKDMFDPRSGDFHALKELEPGNVPLISCGDTSNGLVGYFNIPDAQTYTRKITVAYNGTWPLMAKYHPYKFGIKDDVAVLLPHLPMSDGTMLYIAALLDRMTWRFHYGRKCFREKLAEIKIHIPMKMHDGNPIVDSVYMDDLLSRAKAKVMSDIISSTNDLA